MKTAFLAFFAIILLSGSVRYQEQSRDGISLFSPKSGIFGFWSKTGSVVTPATSTDDIATLGSGGFGILTPAAQLDVLGEQFLFGGDNGTWTARTNATIKSGYFNLKHYTNAEEAFALVNASSGSADNALNLGGGTASYNASTLIRFFAAANTTTTTGTEVMRLTTSGLTLGSGTAVSKIVGNSIVYDVGSIDAGDDSTFTITVTGAVAGNPVQVGVSVASEEGLIITAQCTTNGVVTVRLSNHLLVAAIDPASRTYKVLVTNF